MTGSLAVVVITLGGGMVLSSSGNIDAEVRYGGSGTLNHLEV